MNIVDLIHGRPQQGEVARLVEQASDAIFRDPAEARMLLDRLGPRPWDRKNDLSTIQLGFALRSNASWQIDDREAACADLVALAPVAAGADSLLPVASLLAGPEPIPVNGAAEVLASHFGGCGQDICEHPANLEAALSIIVSASDPVGISRWATVTNSPPLRLAAYRRMTAMSDDSSATSLLDGESAQLVAARASLAYQDGRYDAVLELLPSDHELAGRAALALMLREPTVKDTVRAIAAGFARRHPAARAILAMAEGRFGDAAVAWREADDVQHAGEADILDSPTAKRSVGDVDPSFSWFAYAAGITQRPAGTPPDPDSETNADLGDSRRWLRGILAGEGVEGVHGRHQSLDDLGLVLDLLAKEPGIASSMLASATPDSPAVDSLAALAGAVQSRRAPSEAWVAWSEMNSEIPRIPRPASPLVWLTQGSTIAVPSLESVSALGVDERLAVLAAMVNRGHFGAIRYATRLLDWAELSHVVPAGIPELASLASALASQRSVDPVARRRSTVLAAAALANGVIRGAWTAESAELAVARVATTIADLQPDGSSLSPEEAYRIEKRALEGYPTKTARPATGPVLLLLAGIKSPVAIPKQVAHLYDGDVGLAFMLLDAGRPDEARALLVRSGATHTELAARIAIAVAERHMAGGRPQVALHELAGMPDPKDLRLIDADFLEQLASAIVRHFDDTALDQAIKDADILLKRRNDPQLVTLAVELRLRRVRRRPESGAVDIPDLEAAYALDPGHPQVPRQYAWALVIRASQNVEAYPASAIRDVDLATDIFMGDADLIKGASNISTHAAVTFMKRRDIASADAALALALAINPKNTDAAMGRMSLRNRR